MSIVTRIFLVVAKILINNELNIIKTTFKELGSQYNIIWKFRQVSSLKVFHTVLEPLILIFTDYNFSSCIKQKLLKF